MDGTSGTDDMQWEDVEEELTSTLREACSFSSNGEPQAGEPAALPAALEALRERRPLLTSRRRPVG